MPGDVTCGPPLIDGLVTSTASSVKRQYLTKRTNLDNGGIVKRLVHLLSSFRAGVPVTQCGKLVSVHLVTAYPKQTTCTVCLKRGK